MRRQLLTPLLVALLLQAGDSGGQPAPEQPEPKDVLDILKLSLKDLDDLKGVEVVRVAVRPGVVELVGQVPSAGHKPKLKDRAEAALKNAVEAKKLKGGPFAVDVAGMIDASAPVDARLVEVLNARLFGPGKPLQGKLTEAGVKDGVVAVKGSILAEGMKAALEKEGKAVLDEAVAAKLLPGPYARVDASQLRRYPNEVFGILDASLRDAPELAGFKLIYAEMTPAGVLNLAGLVGSEDQRPALKQRAIAAVTNAVESGKLPKEPALERVDLTKVRVGSSPVDEMLVVESLLPAAPTRVLRTQWYAPDKGELYLAGLVESDASKARLIDELSRLPLVRKVDVGGVLVRQTGLPLPGEPTGTLLDAYDALGRKDADALLVAATASIRNAAPNSAAALNSWYLRAAAHQMMGRRQEAIGDLRVAQALAENLAVAGGYYATLERFQGPQRLALSNLLREGPRAVVGGGR